MATASNEHEQLAGLQIHPIGYTGATDPSTLPDWVGYAGFAWADTSTSGSGYYAVKLWTGSAWINIGGVPISGAAGGDLTGTYPNPTIGANKVTTAKILNANVTLAKIASASANSKLLGSGAAGSGSPYAEITLGTNLSMSGTTLNATGGGGSGTVTSVAQTVPAEFAIAGSPVTTTGTLAITKAVQNANKVWAGPTTGADAQPTFRVMVPADLPGYIDQNNQTANYILVLTDAGKCIEMNNAAPVTLTIPPNSSVAFPVGTILEVYQQGAGQVTITAGVGVTLRAPNGEKTALQFSTVALRQRAVDEWVLAGDTTA